VIEDILCIMWKESRSVLKFHGRRGQLIFSVLPPAILAIYFPWSLGPDWANLYLSLFIAVIIPLLVVSITIPDSFAGERERHTLETMLGSRLTDQSILLGKLLISVIIGWGLAVVVLLLSIVTLNVIHWQGQVIFYKPMIFLASLALSLLISLLAGSLGVHISMRAPTVQVAQQNLLTWLMLPPMLLGFVPLVFFSMPDGVVQMRDVLAKLNGDLVVWFVIGVLFLMDLVLLPLNVVRFKRSNLILD